MTPSNPLYDFIWNSFTVEERDAYALLSIPVWFSPDLALGLCAEFNDSAASSYESITQASAYVFSYEKRGWYFEKGLRPYLLEKAGTLYSEQLTDIHLFLTDYYRDRAGQATGPEKREYTYLMVYHQMQAQPQHAEQVMLALMDDAKKDERVPVLRSLDHIFQLLAHKIEDHPLQGFIRLYLSSLEHENDHKVLKEILKKVEDMADGLDEEKEGMLLKQVYRLELFLNKHVHQQAKKAQKKIAKLEKKIKKLDQVPAPAYEISAPKESMGRRPQKKSHAKFRKIQGVIETIVNLHKKGKHEEAAAELTYLEEMHDGQKDMMCKSFSSIARQLRDIPGARELRKDYIDRAVKCNKFDDVALTMKGEYFKEIGRNDEALSLFDQAFGLNPNNSIPLNAKGELLVRLGRYDEALSLFDQSRQVNPNDEVCLTAKGELLVRLGRYDEALSLFDQASGLNPNNQIPLNAKGELLVRLGRYEEALSLFDQSREVNPNNEVCLTAKGELLVRLGRYDEALSLFDRASGLNPNNQVPLNAKGELLVRLGRYDEALSLFDQSREVNPNNEVCLNAKGELLVRLGRNDEALSLFDQSREVNPNNEVCLNAKGELLVRLGRYDEALSLFDQAFSLNPNNQIPLNAKGELLVRLGRNEEALSLFDQASGLNPNNEIPLTAKGELLVRLGRNEEALSLFDQAHRLNPHNAVPLSAKANLLAKMDRLDDAVTLYRQVLEDAGKYSPVTHCGLGFLLLKRNESEEDIVRAKELFAKAQELEPVNVLAALGLWVASARLGDHEQAMHFKADFEAKRRATQPETAAPSAEADKEEAEFDAIKDEIDSGPMTDPARYRELISRIFAFAAVLTARQQMQARMYHSRF
jgi:tetratricopeptide (TPR) repeat protein